MNKLIRHIFIGVLFIPTLALAHGPSRQKVIETIEVNAPPAAVWAIIEDFCAIETWHPGVAKCEGQSEGGNEKGATRILTLEGSGVEIHEELKSHNAEKMSYKYKLTQTDIKVLPVSTGTYAGKISVSPSDNGGSTVEWNAKFYRSYMRNNPPEDQDDKAAIAAVTAVIKAGLENLKKLAEGGAAAATTAEPDCTNS